MIAKKYIPLLLAALLLAGGAVLLAAAWPIPTAIAGPAGQQPPASAQAVTLYVSSVTGDDGGNCTLDAPCRTLQRAADLAADGDSIWVAAFDNFTPATYTGGGSAVVTIQHSVTMRGGYVYVHSTVPPIHNWTPGFLPSTIDGEGARRAVAISGDVTPTLQLLTLQNGSAVDGGNVYVDGAQPQLLGLLIQNGTATRGGGIYLNNSIALLTGVIVQGNQADQGGGIYSQDSATRVVEAAVYSNTAATAGGGFYLDGPLSLNPLDWPILMNNYIRYNRAPAGAGLYMYESIPLLVNDVIADNQADGHGGAMYLYASSPQGFHNTLAANAGSDGVYLTHLPGSLWPPVPPIPSLPTLTNTVVVSQAVGLYADTTGLPYPLENRATLRGTLWSGNGSDTAGPGDFDIGTTNVYSLPLFTCAGDPPGCNNPYHLQDASPAVDAGVPVALSLPGTDLLVDIDGQLRPSGSGFDIGVDEVTQPTSAWLLPPLSARVAMPGETVTHTHLLLNTGLADDSFDLALTGGQGWSTLLTPSPIDVAAQSSATVTVQVIVPADAAGGTLETTVLTATSRLGPSTAWAVQTTQVVTAPATADLAIAKTADVQRVAPGEAVHFTLTITNDGPLSSTVAYTLTDTAIPTTAVAAIIAPPGCQVNSATAQFTCSLSLPGGAVPVTQELGVVITTTSTYTGPLVNAAAVQGEVTDPNPFNNLAQATVLVWPSAPRIAVTPEQVAVTLVSGYSTTRELSISNQGDAALNWSVVEAIPPATWLAEEPLSGTTAPSQSTAVVLAFGAAGMAAGTYSTTLNVLSNDATSPLVPVTATLTVITFCRPVAATAFTWEPLDPAAGQAVTLTAQATGTAPISFAWDFGDGSSGSGSIVTHTFAAGTYTVSLAAENPCGQETVRHVLLVLPACMPVTGTALFRQPPAPAAGEAVTLTAQATGTEPITFEWAFGDDGTGSGPIVTHTFASAGLYTVTLTATNACGQDLVQSPVTVLPPGTVYRIYLPLVTRGYTSSRLSR